MRFIRFVSLTFMWIACAAPASAHEKPVLTIAADVWCPINCAEGDPLPGIGVELARRAFERQGYEVRYIVMPWARALEEVRAGKIDAVIGANHTDDASLLLPKHPILRVTDDFYVTADSTLRFNGLESLKAARIGIIHDYGYANALQTFLAAHRKTPGAVQEVGGDDALEQNIRKLLAHRIDVAVESRAVMDYTLKRKGLKDKIKRIGGIPQGYVYLAFSPAIPQSKARARAYDASIERMKAEGAFTPLYDAYGLSP